MRLLPGETLRDHRIGILYPMAEPEGAHGGGWLAGVPVSDTETAFFSLKPYWNELREDGLAAVDLLCAEDLWRRLEGRPESRKRPHTTRFGVVLQR